MTNDRPLRIAAGALICAWLLGPPAVGGGEELLPPDPSALPVRILLIMPAESGKLGKQVARLDRALAESRGFLSRAGSLEEADAVVQFTGFRQTVDEKGVRSDGWDGQYRLLTTPARAVRLRGEVPSRFSLLVIDQESWEMKPVVELLARTLARALGRQAPPEEANSDDNSAAFDDSSLAFDDSSWNRELGAPSTASGGRIASRQAFGPIGARSRCRRARHRPARDRASPGGGRRGARAAVRAEVDGQHGHGRWRAYP